MIRKTPSELANDLIFPFDRWDKVGVTRRSTIFGVNVAIADKSDITDIRRAFAELIEQREAEAVKEALAGKK